MRYKVTHRTSYSYLQNVDLSYNEACLQVRNTAKQHVEETRIQIRPEPDFISERTDMFGNRWTHFTVERNFRELVLTAEHRVEILDLSLALDTDSAPWDAPAAVPDREARIFTCASPFIPLSSAFADYGRSSFLPGRSLYEACLDLTRRMYREFTYAPNTTDIFTPVEKILETGSGVCQDYAHFFIAVLRAFGIPCRYVSGYLHTRPAKQSGAHRGADASHAWASVLVPGLGWTDFDPTNGLVVNNEHVTIAWGRDYTDVSPLRGVVLGGNGQNLSVEVKVTPC